MRSPQGRSDRRSRVLRGPVIPGRSGVFLLTALIAALTGGTTGAGAQARPAVEPGSAPVASTRVAPRVLLVISDEVRNHKVRSLLYRAPYGEKLANHTEKAFQQAFPATQVLRELPAGITGSDSADLVVIVGLPSGEIHGTGRMTLTAPFDVRDGKGREAFRLEESAEGKFGYYPDGIEELSETVARKVVQDLLLDQRVQAILAPKPAVDLSSPILGSIGLEEPPPLPWAKPASRGHAELAGEQAILP